MPWRRIRRLFFPTACIVCLAVGYASAGRWIALPGVVIAGLLWFSTYKWRSGFLPLAALVFSVGLAAAGLFASAPLWMMMLSTTLALAGWDVVLLDHTLTDGSPATAVALLEHRHYWSLASALGLGLLAAVAGPMIHFQISFGGMILLAFLALISLEGLRRRLES